MGRKVVIVAFLFAFVWAWYLYVSRDTASIRESLTEGQVKEPRVVLEDFVIYRHEEGRLVARLMARLGHLYEPNEVELNGEVSGWRRTPDGSETIGAESVVGFFKAKSLSAMLTSAELERAEIAGFVEVGVRDHLLTTDYAEYLTATNQIRSERPVRVEGPNRVFTGDEGFIYNLKRQELQMQGLVEGVVRSLDRR